jgi:hypothetical protein
MFFQIYIRCILGHLRERDWARGVYRRRILGHLRERDWARGVGQLPNGWWPWSRSFCRCRPEPQPHYMPSFSGLPAAQTKSWEACDHPCPDLVDDAMLLMLLPILIVVVLLHRGKSIISRSVSSVDLCVIYSLVFLLITRANQTFTNLLVRLELYFGVTNHILMQHGCRFID